MSVYDDIRVERTYQDDKWGSGFDDANTPNDWVCYIVQQASKASCIPHNPTQYREALVKAAATAVAAIETFDRNRGKVAPRHYD